MGTSLKMIDATYGHLARDSEASIRERLEARRNEMATKWPESEAAAAESLQ